MEKSNMIKYTNGNYDVYIDPETGTKIRSSKAEILVPAFAESMDISITHKCDGGCPYCYMDCTEKGPHANLSRKFVDSLHPYTEAALNGNDLSHPQLDDFLVKLKEKNVFANITVNQKHCTPKNLSRLRNWQQNGLIHGVGISLNDTCTDALHEIYSYIKNPIFHMIAGIQPPKAWSDLIEFANANPEKSVTVLVLGYKAVGRGKTFQKENSSILSTIRFLRMNLPMLISSINMSFDNLAIEQLHIKQLMEEKRWKELYMGDDGDFSFYIDMAANNFSKNSMSDKKYDMGSLSVDQMFNGIRRKK